MKILITGVAGTGKSTISKELNRRGITSIDFSDVSGMCYWRDKITKEKTEYPITSDFNWFDSHERICNVERLKEILDEHKDLIITGIAGNQTEYFNLFDKILLLQCNPETITQRMQTRESPWGKTKVEQDYTLKWQKIFDPLCLSIGLTPVNTEGSLDEVVDRIISMV
jgi:broad-specificity NMP kinase